MGENGVTRNIDKFQSATGLYETRPLDTPEARAEIEELRRGERTFDTPEAQAEIAQKRRGDRPLDMMP